MTSDSGRLTLATNAAARWAGELAEWAIPDHILAQAPEPPWFFPPEIFRGPVSNDDTPSRRKAREALPEGGSVLDVGCGGGAAGLALVPRAGHVTGFDQSAELLEVFADEAARLGVAHQAIQGSWPADEAKAPAADVVVSNHVVYNISDLAGFARALTIHGRNRVVVEMSAHHPLARMVPLWRHFWDLERPEGPTAELALEVLAEAGIGCEFERATRTTTRQIPRDQQVAFTRRRLCLGPDRDAEIEAMLPAPDEQAMGEAYTIYWDGTAV